MGTRGRLIVWLISALAGLAVIIGSAVNMAKGRAFARHVAVEGGELVGVTHIDKSRSMIWIKDVDDPAEIKLLFDGQPLTVTELDRPTATLWVACVTR